MKPKLRVLPAYDPRADAIATMYELTDLYRVGLLAVAMTEKAGQNDLTPLARQLANEALERLSKINIPEDDTPRPH